ncbi:hypothetical protein Pcac1_g21678 [Phytophthora cactorum]|nr:hypothetical protein Pcac1_g21678 [Phytophthora cactorum]KAG3138138.1 hypothetical protein C6341_g20760 [Phytophthora cactorum]
MDTLVQYLEGLFPRTARNKQEIDTTQFIIWQIGRLSTAVTDGLTTTKAKIGFFDGGSRGNPGPGGSGSVIVEYDYATKTCRPLWIASTSLAHQATTNNVAECVGLQRLLQRAVDSKWRDFHIVGDSALVLRMMRLKQPSKTKKTPTLVQIIEEAGRNW